MNKGFDAPGTYDDAAADYDLASARFWSFVSERTVARLALSRRASVLDIPCGPGWSALAAAEAVGPGGRVVAIDLAPRMVALAREKASRRELGNIEFLVSDMTRIVYPPESFDAVVCVLGLFFASDMAEQVARLWRLVRPGGLLAVSTLGRHFFSPLYDVWKSGVQAELDGADVSGPWERTSDPAVVSGLMRLGGVPCPDVVEEDRVLPLDTPEDWWRIVMGTGMRKWVTDLGEDAAGRVRERNLQWARDHGIESLKLSAVYALARRG